MLNADHKNIIPRFIRALAKTRGAQDYAGEVVFLMKLDEHDYNMKRVYNFASKIGSKAQKEALKKLAAKNEYLRRRMGKI